MAELWSGDGIKREVASVVFSFFEAGKNKDLASLNSLHGPAGIFSKFDDVPPYTRQSSEEAFTYEQAAFANLSDYQYSLEDLRIDIVGGTAVATFYLQAKGMVVNDYSFEGQTVSSRARVTFILARFEGSWRIVHEHFSAIPGWKEARPSSDGQEGAP